MTKIMSQSLMVFSRWAMVITVEPFSFSRTTLQIVCSVSGSTCAVGSSRMTIFLLCKRTRAKQISCRSPTLKFAPCSNNWWSSFPSKLSTNSFSWTISKARHNSTSWNCSTRSRFSLKDPLKRTGRWPSTDTHHLKVNVLYCDVINHYGTLGIWHEQKAATRDDLPAPVRPVTPTLVPPFIWRLTFLNTWGPPG